VRLKSSEAIFTACFGCFSEDAFNIRQAMSYYFGPVTFTRTYERSGGETDGASTRGPVSVDGSIVALLSPRVAVVVDVRGGSVRAVSNRCRWFSEPAGIDAAE